MNQPTRVLSLTLPKSVEHLVRKKKRCARRDCSPKYDPQPYCSPISRGESQTVLDPLPLGSFLVRPSATCRNMLALSQRVPTGVLHARIRMLPSGGFTTGERDADRVFPTLGSLLRAVQFHQCKPLAVSREHVRRVLQGDWRTDVPFSAASGSGVFEAAPSLQTTTASSDSIAPAALLRADTSSEEMSISSAASSSSSSSLSMRSSRARPLPAAPRRRVRVDQLQLGDELGHGSFGAVYRGTLHGQTVAVKVVLDTVAQSELVDEGRIMSQVAEHDNVCTMLGVTDAPNVMLIVEFCAGGSLYERLQSDAHIDGAWMHYWLRGIAEGMRHLHASNVVHRDLAARNVLLDAQHRPKIADFGMSRVVSPSGGVTKTDTGPLKWMAPESIRERQ